MSEQHATYVHSLYKRERLKTIEVKIGDVPLGHMHPIRVQSMTTTDTMDTEATVSQALRMAASGAEYVRITAPSIKEAQNLEEIKKSLRAKGCEVPLVADIHFTPNAAELAARIVEKVRVNPGNYADKKKFQNIEYTDASYQAELERIHDRFAPLVKICKEYGTAMRIGANHGSLSDRIMSRYGDTPLGMVESAMEFVRICDQYGYDQLVISMKASNPQVMVQAYRLLVQKMEAHGKLYPLHLGVTEAGEGEDGRIKSAQGIGALLMDGIGDTVRVSLTEEPEYESPVARFLVNMVEQGAMDWTPPSGALPPQQVDPYAFHRRDSHTLDMIGGGQPPRVVAHFGKDAPREALGEAGYAYQALLDKYAFTDMAADLGYFEGGLPPFDLPGGMHRILPAMQWLQQREQGESHPLFDSPAAFSEAGQTHPLLNFVAIRPDTVEEAQALPTSVCLVLRGEGGFAYRYMAYRLMELGLRHPIVLHHAIPEKFEFYDDSALPDHLRLDEGAKQQLWLAAQTGSAVVDGYVDGLWFGLGRKVPVRCAFGILQAGRLRMTKTEYISCPSCGRTLFDLQETTARIRQRTEHLKGVKIGIMGCIVNGPGEMADADYGYVGVGPGKIALYRGQEVVARGVRTEEAVDKLIDLIREDGNWLEPVQ